MNVKNLPIVCFDFLLNANIHAQVDIHTADPLSNSYLEP